MTGSDSVRAIQTMLGRFESLSQKLEEQFGSRERIAQRPFRRSEEVISRLEGIVIPSRSSSVSSGLLKSWRLVASGEISLSDLSSLEVNRLCAVPSIAMSQLFISKLQQAGVLITERGILGLVHSYHQEWADLINRFGAVDCIKGCLARLPEERSSRLDIWRTNLRFLVDPNDVDHLSAEMVAIRLSPHHLSTRFSIAEDSAFMSAVASTSVRRLCQRFRASAEDYEYLTGTLLAYHYFRPRDLGRALASAILVHRGVPPQDFRRAVIEAGSSHPSLGSLPLHRPAWLALIGERALAALEQWPWDQQD